VQTVWVCDSFSHCGPVNIIALKMTPHVSKTIIKVSEDKTSWVVSDQLAITLGVFKLIWPQICFIRPLKC